MPAQSLTPEEEFVLDAAFGRVEAARRAVDQARRELGSVMRSVGLAASARHLRRSRQWALQLAQESEEPRPTPEEGALPASDELADSIRRLGIVEPIVVEALGDELLRVVDGHRRLRIAREAGMTSLPVSLLLAPREQLPPRTAPPGSAATTPRGTLSRNIALAESAAKDHRKVRFVYRGLNGNTGPRTVDVWGTVWRSGLPHMVGYDDDRAAIRTFRLDRVLDALEDVGDGTPAPENFSAERNVWSQLDPEVIEAMQATFLRVFQEVNKQKVELDDEELTRLLESDDA